MSKRIYGDPRRLHSDMFPEFNNETQTIDLQEEYLNVELKSPKVGTVQTLTYIGKNSSYFLFDGGFKDYVRVENRPSEAKYLVNTNVGDTVDIFISDVNQNIYFIKGSLVDLYETKARLSLTDLEEDTAVTCVVKELTPAGYNVEIDYEGVTLPGFMPNTLAGVNKLFNPESIVGSRFDVVIDNYSKEMGTYIVSRKKYLQTLIPQEVKKLEYDKVYTGFVTGARDFGVFVEFNECLTGMIHKTNINQAYVNNIGSIQPGTPIDFYIKEIIQKDNKIILTQIIRDTLWDTIKIGQTFDTLVKDMKSFGALVILDEETNGLIHTSELEKTSRKLNGGDKVKVKVISVDRGNRKIFLTLV